MTEAETEAKTASAEKKQSSHYIEDGHHHQLLPGQPFGYGVEDDDKPIKDNLKMAVLSIVFCPLNGLIATYKSYQCRAKMKENKRHEAHLAAVVSRRFSFSGMVIGISFGILYLVIFVFKLTK